MTESSNIAIRQLTEAIAASREVADRRIEALNAAVERTTSNVDRALEGMQRSVDRIERQVSLAVEGMQLIEDERSCLAFVYAAARQQTFHSGDSVWQQAARWNSR